MSSISKNLNVQNVLKCILQRLPVLGGVKVKIVAYTTVVLSPSIVQQEISHGHCILLDDYIPSRYPFLVSPLPHIHHLCSSIESAVKYDWNMYWHDHFFYRKADVILDYSLLRYWWASSVSSSGFCLIQLGYGGCSYHLQVNDVVLDFGV